MISFLAGDGIAVRKWGDHRAALLHAVVAGQTLLMLAAAVLAAALEPLADVQRDVIVALLAVALGMQNSAARRLAVPDLTTTVLTMTITAIAADLRLGGVRTRLRRVLAVTAMLLGALIGVILVLHEGIAIAVSPPPGWSRRSASH